MNAWAWGDSLHGPGSFLLALRFRKLHEEAQPRVPGHFRFVAEAHSQGILKRRVPILCT